MGDGDSSIVRSEDALHPPLVSTEDAPRERTMSTTDAAPRARADAESKLDCPQLILLVGLPGAGKSSFVQALAADEEWKSIVLPISFDDAEAAESAHEFSPEAWRRARQAVSQRVGRILEESFASARPHGMPLLIVLDDNFYLRSMRKTYFQLARAQRAQYKLVVFDASVTECAARNGGRSGRARVPDFVVEHMADTIEWPVAAPAAGSEEEANSSIGAPGGELLQERAASSQSPKKLSASGTWERHASVFHVAVEDLRQQNRDNSFVFSEDLRARFADFLFKNVSIPPEVDQDGFGGGPEEQPPSHVLELRLRTLVSGAMKAISGSANKKEVGKTLAALKQIAVKRLKEKGVDAEEVCDTFQRQCVFEVQKCL